MKLTSYKPELVTEKSFPGLLECKFKHTVSKAEATLEYTGPPISVDVWKQMLAFFQWTYDTTHSESQVRLFVNTKTRVWAAWAFPQEARTGMTARELDTPEKAKQRSQFADSEGWIYFGTVHHHCSCSAFQSGTDMANERDQDGLHITIGNMASNRYDLHARFYLGGFGFEPDLSKFWDIGEANKEMIPKDLWDRVARHQMTEKVKPDVEYPAQWKENLIEVKTAFQRESTPYQSQGWTPGGYSGSGYTPWRDDQIPLWQRARKALGELAEDVIDDKEWTEEKLCEVLEQLVLDDTVFGRIAEVMHKHKVSLDAIWEEVPHDGDLSKVRAQYCATESSANKALLAEQNGKKDKKGKGKHQQAPAEQKALPKPEDTNDMSEGYGYTT
jgi:hypothetical protein